MWKKFYSRNQLTPKNDIHLENSYKTLIFDEPTLNAKDPTIEKQSNL